MSYIVFKLPKNLDNRLLSFALVVFKHLELNLKIFSILKGKHSSKGKYKSNCVERNVWV